ncbi:ABC transporter permease [Streptomyces formicae]|uniref:Putative ABC transport system integral membrane protein n=1 Tax=Streptomyces formicae TaxID=1616117 RepID=A0A291QI04_9ACTN|nr:ABC transporter permease [Streptomyces formicae]ATL31075.1 putative ABC transport system integral membrane protein [Streptomyces formicae]
MSVLRPTGLATAAVRSRPSALAGAFAAFVLVATVVTGSVSMTVSASTASTALPGADPAVRDQLAELSDLGIGFCVMTVYLAVFVISQVMALAVAQRRRESALLRAIGAEPGQIRRMVAVEALGTALAALPVGYGLGALLGRFWLRGLATRGMAPADISFRVGWQPLVAAGAVLVVCSQLGGLIAGWRASRTRPSAALAESSVQGGERVGAVRGVASLVALAGAVVLTVVAVAGSVENASQMIPLVLLCHLAAIGLAGPWIGRCVIALCARSRRAFGGVAGELAVAGTRARARRLSAAITPVALVTAFAVAELTTITGSRTDSPGEKWGTAFLTLVVVGFGGLVAANTLVMLALERLREFSLLRAVGAERWQVVRTVAAECAIVTLAGVGTGLAAGCAVMLPIGTRTGTPLSGVPVWAWLAVALGGAVLVGVFSGTPLLRMLRVRPMDGLTRRGN